MIKALFITGTDTDVGKTVTSKAILQAFDAKGFSTIGYKPVAAGCEKTADGFRNSDALHLMNAATCECDYADVNSYPLELPTSPHIAAKHEHKVIEFSALSEALQQHKSKADVVLVEGAGGWRVPVSESEFLSSWVKQERLPVVLVVGIKLGCLNHARLTAECVKNDGLDLVGWVANRINPGTEHYQEIIEALKTMIDAPQLGEIPYVPSAKRKDLGKYINIDALLSS